MVPLQQGDGRMSLSDLEKLQKIQHTLVFEDGLYATDVEDVANGEVIYLLKKLLSD